MSERTYVLLAENGGEDVPLTIASAFALESSGYIIPAPSTEQVWRFRVAKGMDRYEVMEALRGFQPPRKK